LKTESCLGVGKKGKDQLMDSVTSMEINNID